MSITAVNPQNLRAATSRTTTSQAGIGSANIWRIDCIIPGGWQILIPDPRAVAIVLQPFVVEIKLMGEEYVATSSISNNYEFGETVTQTLKNYFVLLVEELIWLEKHEGELSPAIHEDLELLRNYIRIA